MRSGIKYIFLTVFVLFCFSISGQASEKPVKATSGVELQLLAQNGEDDPFPDDLEADDERFRIADPIEPFNKAMFHFNDKLYFWVLKPVAKGYRKVVPTFARTGIKNFFDNLGMPMRAVNALLQGKGQKAGIEVGRFLFNSTVGVLGFGNPTADWKELNPEPEDTGQTLGTYGLGHGFYIVWPFFGPSSVRGTLGMVGDYFLDPVTYVNPWELAAGADVTDKINDTSFRIGDYESFKDAALVPYVSMRNAYVQRREKSLKN